LEEKYGISLVEWKEKRIISIACFKDKSTTVLAKFINAYKSASSRIIMEGVFFGPEVIVC
jgi:hypothetical protein